MERTKLTYVDALRGLAALSVAFFHFSSVTYPHAVTPEWLSPLTSFGGSGVTLFFLISAFTLCLSMSARNEQEVAPVANYFIRRFSRIAPLFYFWILVSYLRDASVFNLQHSVSEFYPNIFFFMNFCPGSESGLVWSSWSIGVEILFYLLLPLIFATINNARRAIVAVFVALGAKLCWYFVVMNVLADHKLAERYYLFSFLNHLPTFLMGIVCFYAYKQIGARLSERRGLAYLLISTFIVAYLAATYGGLRYIFNDVTAQALIFSALLLGLSICPLSVFVNRFSCFYGKISYSFYLSHATVFCLMSPVFSSIYASNSSRSLAYLLSFAAGLFVITCLSSVTYLCIETPGINLGKIIIRRSTFPSICTSASRRIIKDLAVSSPLAAAVVTIILLVAMVRYVPYVV